MGNCACCSSDKAAEQRAKTEYIRKSNTMADADQKSEESKDEKKEENIIIINNYNALRNADNELVARALFDVLDNAQIAKIIGRVDNEEVLQQRAKEFKLNRSIVPRVGTPESVFRAENDADIQQKRWKWYQENIELFKLVLQNNGYDFEDIQCSISGTKPLGMKMELFTEFKKELVTTINSAKHRISKELGKEVKFRVVLQGSYIVGYSANPFKGDRYIPTYLFDATKKSDYDFRLFADGLDVYVEKLRNDGVDIKDWSFKTKENAHIIYPYGSSMAKILPECVPFIQKFETMTKKFNNGKAIGLQISVFTKNIGFEPLPWNIEIPMQ